MDLQIQSKTKQRESEDYLDSYRIDYSEENKEKLKTMKAREIILYAV
ncbi:hypothetical protein [New Jersey aster yellows phytoplasma]|nr:hypothetical protein [New Jersey aster yellows phytoplasma]